ncbi:hypothetical protein [Bacillus sp. JCM 19034]|uniref:hypothetical protein n=1 Tax=Bacillus sp. JCM 19034 TaxID=1481928 RepID=UPI000A97E3BF|nr:hypothetical protein [Bacillus sp. JCM 19034]
MGEEVRVQEKKSGSLYKGLLVGGAIAVGLVLAKKEWRTKVISECKQMTKKYI